MLKINVGGKSTEGLASGATATFEVDQKNGQWFIGDTIFNGDIVSIGKNRYHILWNSRSYTVELIEAVPTDKTFRFIINGQLFETTVKDRFDLLLEGLGMQASVSRKINNLKAPMPGMIQSVAVAAEQEVQKGDTLLVLVAMKMENVIKSPGSGIVKTIKITPGEIVEKNQVLIEFQ
jgi:biotin carboxyl carrier protein